MESPNLSKSQTIFGADPAQQLFPHPAPITKQAVTPYKIPTRILAPEVIGFALRTLFPVEAELVAVLRRLFLLNDLPLTRLFLHMKNPKKSTHQSRTRKAQKRRRRRLCNCPP